MNKTTKASDQPVLWLDITGAYGAHADAPADGTNVFQAINDSPRGHEDKDGVEHFNDRVSTPFGLLGSLKTHLVTGEGGQPEHVIDQADEVVLVSRKPFDQWPDDQKVGVAIELNPFGFQVFTLNARNGMVRYRLLDTAVRWRDQPDEDVEQHVALRTLSQWTPEGPLPDRLTHKTDIQVVRTAQ